MTRFADSRRLVVIGFSSFSFVDSLACVVFSRAMTGRAGAI